MKYSFSILFIILFVSFSCKKEPVVVTPTPPKNEIQLGTSQLEPSSLAFIPYRVSRD